MDLEKKLNFEKSKKHLTINIDAENYEFITKYRGLASNLLNEAIAALKIAFENTDNPEEIEITLNLTKYGKFEAKISGPKGIRTPDLQHVSKSSNLGVFSQIKPKLNDSEILNQNLGLTFPFNIGSKEIRGEPGISIGTFISQDGMKERFMQYCLDTGTRNESTRKSYYRALSSLESIMVPSDLVGIKVTKTHTRALLKFYAFFNCDCMYSSGFNGYTIEQWKGNQRRTVCDVGTRSEYKTKDLKPEEVIAACSKLDRSYQVFFTLIGYSGSRLTHLYNWLLKEDRQLEHINGVLRADIRDTSSGTKKEAYLYFPMELEKAILAYRHPCCKDEMEKILARTGEEGRPVNASSLRKWNFNTLLDHMERIYANAIQGRAADGVDAAHYFDTAGKAAKWYPKALPSLREGLPIPEWMENAEWELPKSKRGLPNKGATGFDRIGKKRRNKVQKLLAENVPVKQIARMMKMSTLSVRKIRDGSATGKV